MDYIVDREQQQPCDNNADNAREQTDDACLRVENGGDIPLGGADGAQDTDLLGPLEDGYIGDNADHDRGYDQ